MKLVNLQPSICNVILAIIPPMSSPSVSGASTATPAMRQYFDAKRQYRDALVFFRMGDFYEMFFEDALTAARALELTLTSRSKDASGTAIPMCGVPFHAADGYIARLVRKGFRVAVVEQVEDPKKAKGLVRREVVRVVSPGTLTDAGYLEAREPAFLMAIAVAGAERIGVALLDISTGEFTAGEYAGADGRTALVRELSILRPREIVAALGNTAAGAWVAAAQLDARMTPVETWTFDPDTASRTLLAQLRAQSLQGFGLEGHEAAVTAAGALVQYLHDTQKAELAHVRGHQLPQRSGLPADRCRDLEESRGPRSGRRRARPDRCCTSSIAPSPRWAAGCCGGGCSARSSRSSGFTIVSMRSKISPSAVRRGPSCATR